MKYIYTYAVWRSWCPFYRTRETILKHGWCCSLPNPRRVHTLDVWWDGTWWRPWPVTSIGVVELIRMSTMPDQLRAVITALILNSLFTISQERPVIFHYPRTDLETPKLGSRPLTHSFKLLKEKPTTLCFAGMQNSKISKSKTTIQANKFLLGMILNHEKSIYTWMQLNS